MTFDNLLGTGRICKNTV